MENDKVVYITQEGLNRLQSELDVLRNKPLSTLRAE